VQEWIRREKIVDLIHLLKGDFGKERISNFNKNFHSFFFAFCCNAHLPVKAAAFWRQTGSRRIRWSGVLRLLRVRMALPETHPYLLQSSLQRLNGF